MDVAEGPPDDPSRKPMDVPEGVGASHAPDTLQAEPSPAGGRPFGLLAYLRKHSRRIAMLVLVAGVALTARSLEPLWPQERDVELRLGDPAVVRSVDIAWIRRGDGAGQGASWRFTPGAAPRALLSRLRLPEGTYDVEIDIDREGSGAESLRRVVTLDTPDRVTLPVP